LSLTFISYSAAQYSVNWAKGFGGERKDKASGVIETMDGGILLAGRVIRKNTYLWLLKTDAHGNELWGKTYEKYHRSGANAVIQTQHDTAIVAAGFCVVKRKFSHNINGWILKTDRAGKVLWERAYGKKGDEEIVDLISDGVGGYVACGYSNSNEDNEKEFWVFRVDENGDVLWEKFFGESSEDAASCLTLTYDGHIVAAGYGINRNKKVLRVIKIDIDNGDDIWDIPWLNDASREAHDIAETPDSSLIIAGTFQKDAMDTQNALLYKISADSDSVWEQTFDYNGKEEATSVEISYDGKILIAGYTKFKNESDDADFWTRKTELDGTLIWENVFNRGSLDYAYDICETKDNGIAQAGATYSSEEGWDYALMKYRNDEMTRINVIQPEDSVVTTTSIEYDLEACISSALKLENAEVFVNGSLQFHDAMNSNLITDKDCRFPLFKKILLIEGKNEIVIQVTDEKGFIINDKRIIYYIPSPQTGW